MFVSGVVLESGIMLAEACVQEPSDFLAIEQVASVLPSVRPIDYDTRMTTILRQHQGYLRTVARSVCSALGLVDPDDIVQQTCLQAWRKRQTFDYDRCAKAWLVRVLKNEYFQTIRKGAHCVSAESEQLPRSLQDPFDAISTVDAIAMTQAFKTLSKDQREAVVLILVFGFTYEEASGFLNCAVGTLKSRVARGRSNLAALLEN